MGIKGLFKRDAPNDVPATTMEELVTEHHFEARPASLRGPSHRDSGFRDSGNLEQTRHEVMVNYLFQQQCSTMWIGYDASDNEGVMVRRTMGDYVACPPNIMESVFARGVRQLSLPSVMTVRSRVIQSYLSPYPDAIDVPVGKGLKVQLLPSMEHLSMARKYHQAAFIADEGLLVVWDDNPNKLFARAKHMENEMMNLSWNAEAYSEYGMEKTGNISIEELDTEESGTPASAERPTHLLNAILVGFTLFLITVMLGAGFRQIAIEVVVDQNYLRCAFLLLTPVQVFFTLFFAQVVVGGISQLVGPIRQMWTNSKYYSAVRPQRLKSRPLPHVTIQCPVYKEGLAGVIEPTVMSLKQAISTYELQGGTANIFVNDDGLQIIDEDQRNARIDFYADHSIGWTARPKHNSDGFVRRGKFKKASNMNFGLMLSNNVEEKLSQVHRDAGWTQFQETVEYERCLEEVVVEHGRAWAAGDIRIGDYILIIDSDTRVPADCLLDAVSEMEQSPEVGIMQFSSGVMQVAHTWFEDAITFFTNLIYTAIKYTVSNGDVAPFVGHNAILRWSAIQSIGHFDEDGYEKFWSEAHVSEDFEMSLKLQTIGYTIRLAAWAGDGFKEGVSLTVYDELARWEKYAYGCNELLFHPLRVWLWKGPFTPLFRRFLLSPISLTSKITILAYIGTYYAIGAAWILTLANYFAWGLFAGYLDKYYIDSWKVWFSIIIVFNGLGNVSLAMMRYRSRERSSFFGALLENIKWIPMLVLFLGGLSLHVSQALLCHMFEINMTWGATSKETEDSNFFEEVPKILKRFKFSMALSTSWILMMIIFAKASFIPVGWRITDFIAILPMSTITISTFLLPIALNPALMTFTF